MPNWVWWWEGSIVNFHRTSKTSATWVCSKICSSMELEKEKKELACASQLSETLLHSENKHWRRSHLIMWTLKKCPLWIFLRSPGSSICNSIGLLGVNRGVCPRGRRDCTNFLQFLTDLLIGNMHCDLIIGRGKQSAKPTQIRSWTRPSRASEGAVRVRYPQSGRLIKGHCRSHQVAIEQLN